MRLVGIDIDSASLRVVRLEKSFRDLAVLSVDERALKTGDNQEISAALSQLKAEGALDGDTLAIALPGERGYVRFLEIPPTDADKRGVLVRNQLDGALPEGIEERMIVGSQVLYEAKGAPTQVLAVAASHEAVSGALQRITSAGLDPQILTAELAALGALAQKVAPPEGLVLVDVAHTHTNFVIVSKGVFCAGRTLKRGLHDLAQPLSRSLKMSAREVLQRANDGGLSGLPSDLFGDAALPIAAEVRRTIAGLRAKGLPAPERLSLTGEAARLPGLAEALGQLLGAVAVPLDIPALKLRPSNKKIGAAPLSSLVKEDGARFARALGLALTGTDRAKVLSLRQGSFSYRTDLSKVAGRFLRAAVVMLGLLLLGGVTLFSRYQNLQAERDHEIKKLSVLVKEVASKEMSDLDQIDDLIHIDKASIKKPWPETTAFDVLLEISKRIPKEVTVDVNKIDIRAKKTTLTGEIDNAGDIDTITSALKDFSCFKEIKQGNVKQITTRDGRQRREFTLDIDTTCP
jgi:general secretion pathway protein L